MKTCSYCKETKGLCGFYKNKKMKDGLNSICKGCTSSIEKLRKGNNKKFVQRLKNLKGCANCGYNRVPEVLCFAHIDPSTKWSKGLPWDSRRNGSAINLSWSRKRIKLEIRKCKILCANCHMEETYETCI